MAGWRTRGLCRRLPLRRHLRLEASAALVALDQPLAERRGARLLARQRGSQAFELRAQRGHVLIALRERTAQAGRAPALFAELGARARELLGQAAAALAFLGQRGFERVHLAAERARTLRQGPAVLALLGERILSLIQLAPLRQRLLLQGVALGDHDAQPVGARSLVFRRVRQLVRPRLERAALLSELVHAPPLGREFRLARLGLLLKVEDVLLERSNLRRGSFGAQCIALNGERVRPHPRV